MISLFYIQIKSVFGLFRSTRNHFFLKKIPPTNIKHQKNLKRCPSDRSTRASCKGKIQVTVSMIHTTRLQFDGGQNQAETHPHSNILPRDGGNSNSNTSSHSIDVDTLY